MTVYVDNAKIPFRGFLMCHMFADSLEELHAMADKIGLRRSWFQVGTNLEHYDVSLSMRALALQHGARLINREQMRALIRTRMEARGYRPRPKVGA